MCKIAFMSPAITLPQNTSTVRRSCWTTSFVPEILLLLLVLVACGAPDRSQRVCINGEPTAFFREGDSTVLRVQFSRSGQSSQEDIEFSNGPVLRINQVGCDTVIQTFELPTTRDVQSFPAFKRVALERFRAYAQIDPRLYPFGQYARVLEAVPDEFPVGAPANLAPGLIVRAFRVPTTNGTTWQVRYEQDLTQVENPQ